MIYGLSYRRDGEKWSLNMNEIKVWNFEDSTVRTLTINNEPYFVGKDVAVILGYKNPQEAIRGHVDDEDKGVSEILTPGGKQMMPVINESGLYSLILGSKLPKAKEFKRWVTSEVLPSIRKHGLYATEELLNNPDVMIAVLTELKTEREKTAKLQNTVAVQNQQLAELQPKATYYDVVLNCPDLVTTTTIAKDFGWSAIKLNGFLHEHGIQFKQGDIWHLYQQYAEQGYAATRTSIFEGRDGEQHSREHTYWTQKGRLFIYDLLKSNNILPLVERESA